MAKYLRVAMCARVYSGSSSQDTDQHGSEMSFSGSWSHCSHTQDAENCGSCVLLAHSFCVCVCVFHYFLNFYFILFFYAPYSIPQPPLHPPSNCATSHTSSLPHPVSMWMCPPITHLTSKHPGVCSLLRIRCTIS